MAGVPAAETDVVIVGGGIMGAATAHALGRRGVRTTLIEQFAIGHTRGSSHGRARIFRLSYPQRRYVAMALEALPLWRRLESESGRPLLSITGGYEAGPGIRANAAALASCGVGAEIMTGAEVARRSSVLRLPAAAEVLYQAGSGVVRADGALTAFMAGARARGVAIMEEATVTGVTARGESLLVSTSAGAVRAGRVVITAGAWAPGLLASLGLHYPLRPTRETVGFWPLAGDSIPILVEWGNPSVYALASPGQGLKAGEHIAGPAASPEDEAELDRASLQRLGAWVAERFPGAQAHPHHAETCFYTNTPDERFVVERRGPLVVGSPCSGHGFKFAPLIGEMLADLATG